MPPGDDRRRERRQALAQYRQRAPLYDAELAAFAPIRRDAIAALELQAGASVIDVGCGTGLSFEGLRRGVGPSGHVLGLDPSPDMLALARQRIARRGWDNVHVVRGFAADAPISGRADAALFMFTHDAMRDPVALDHVLQHLRHGARVVAAGLQWAPAWQWPTNAFVLMAALYSVSSLEGLQRPWDRLATRLRHIEVQTTLLGGIYLARGEVA